MADVKRYTKAEKAAIMKTAQERGTAHFEAQVKQLVVAKAPHVQTHDPEEDKAAAVYLAAQILKSLHNFCSQFHNGEKIGRAAINLVKDVADYATVMNDEFPGMNYPATDDDAPSNVNTETTENTPSQNPGKASEKIIWN